MRTLLLACLLLLSLAPARAEISDPKLAAEIEKLLAAVGGREVWRDARGFKMAEIMYTDQSPVPVMRHFWIDFDRPRIKQTSIGLGVRQAMALNGEHGWTERDGEVTAWSREQVAGWRSFWPGIPTRVIHLLASDDPSLTAKWRDGVIDFFIDGKRVVWMGLDENGVPVVYGRDERHTETHFLGKMLAYGPVTLWSEATEPGGKWRVVMVDYELMNEPHTESFAPPD